MHSIFHHRGQSCDLASASWLDTIEKEGFAAVIFDCDGTLVDSSDAHMQAMQAAALEQGQEMAAAWYRSRTGLDRISLFEEFSLTTPVHFNIEQACLKSIASFEHFVDQIRPIPATVELATQLRKNNFPLAVATNAERTVAEQSLSAAKVRQLFDLIVSISDDVPPKPSPSMFELAAKRLALSAEEILVFEDSAQGVYAAACAGMSVIQLIE